MQQLYLPVLMHAWAMVRSGQAKEDKRACKVNLNMLDIVCKNQLLEML